MHMTFSLTATNAAGRVIKTRNGRVDYNFHGYNTRSMNGNFTLHGMKSHDKSAGTLGGAPTISGLLLIPELDRAFRMQVADSPDFEILVVDFKYLGECHPAWNNEFYLPADMCGSFKVQLHKDDLSIKSLSFEIAGMPIQGKIDYLGEAAINRNYVVIDLQKVMLPGDPKPFVVPSHISCTLETDKGKLVISGDFSVKKIKQK